jgi:hypothetical protein
MTANFPRGKLPCHLAQGAGRTNCTRLFSGCPELSRSYSRGTFQPRWLSLSPRSGAKDATPWTILSWGSTLLHGVSCCLRRRSLDRRHLSWGFVPLQRSRWGESTSSRSWHRPVARSAADGSHSVGFGVARRFSQPLSDFFLSPPSHHFQAGGAPGIHPSGS